MGERWDDERAQRQEEGTWFSADGEVTPEFRERVELFERYSRDELEYPKIFSELGFTFIDDGCDGYCPECENQKTCAVYPELKDEWEALK
jgi:hypothetical protein